MSSRLCVEAMSPWQLYFGLSGRIDRATFWHGVWVLTLVTLVVSALLDIAGGVDERLERRLPLLLLWPGVALSVKRWHDRDHSAWWGVVVLLLLMFLPRGAWIGWLWLLLDNGLRPGSLGANRFGPPQVQDVSVRRRRAGGEAPARAALSPESADPPGADKYGLSTEPPSDLAKPASPA